MRVALLVLLSIAFGACKKNRDRIDMTAVLDARYSVTGTMKDFTNATYTGSYPHEIVLEKNSNNQGTMVPAELGIPGHLILVGGSKSYYSNFAVIITIDPNNNKITGITNHYGQPSPNGRSATLDPSGVNAWDPVAKVIKIKYWLDEPATITPHRTSFDETWTYLGPK